MVGEPFFEENMTSKNKADQYTLKMLITIRRITRIISKIRNGLRTSWILPKLTKARSKIMKMISTILMTALRIA